MEVEQDVEPTGVFIIGGLTKEEWDKIETALKITGKDTQYFTTEEMQTALAAVGITPDRIQYIKGVEDGS